MENQKVNEIEYNMLYLADDGLGITDLISKKLKISKPRVNEIMENLVKKGFVTKEKSIIFKNCY